MAVLQSATLCKGHTKSGMLGVSQVVSHVTTFRYFQHHVQMCGVLKCVIKVADEFTIRKKDKSF